MNKLTKPYQIEIAGVGGTGVLTAAHLLGNAALLEGIKAVQSEIHGMAQRGGVVNTEVRLGPVYGSLIPTGEADVLLSFEAAETTRAIKKVRPKTGEVIMNTHKIVPPSLSLKKDAEYPKLEDLLSVIKKFTKNVYPINAFELAEKTGDIRTQNVILLGALYTLPKFPLAMDALKKAVEIRFKGKEDVIEANFKALELGSKEMQKQLK